MTWDDIEEILFDGMPEEIAAVRCPECGGAIKATYYPKTPSTEIRCLGCGIVARGYKPCKVPNFAREKLTQK